MSKKRTIAAVVAGVALAGAWWLAAGTKWTDNDCVQVRVDFGQLRNNRVIDTCVPAAASVTAAAALGSAGVQLEGTGKYGLQVVCRVDGLPSAVTPINVAGHEGYTERCLDMPAEFAYWSVLVKRRATMLNQLDLSTKWGWASVGIQELQLEPGDSLALVFTENDNVRFPQ